MATLGRFTVMLHQSQQQLEISTVEEPSFITILSIHNLTHCIDGALSLKVSLRLQAGLVFLPVPHFPAHLLDISAGGHIIGRSSKPRRAHTYSCNHQGLMISYCCYTFNVQRRRLRP